MIGVWDYTVILTYLSMLAGVLGMFMATTGHATLAVLLLMICGLLDLFDGPVARTKKNRTAEQKTFGIQIDSLNDLICFGVLPGVIVCAYCGQSYVSIAISACYVLAALIRLAWFNVDEEERQSEQEGVRQSYLGMPVTMVALFLPTIMSVDKLAGLPSGKIAPAALVVFAVMFLTPFHLKKAQTVGKIVMLVLGVAALVIVFLAGTDL